MAPSRYESASADPSPLAQPLHFTFANRDAPNRFLKGAMTERLASWSATDLPKRGVPSKELINVYRRWGEGAIGLILTGNFMIAYDHLESAGNAIITPNDKPEGPRFEAFKEMATVGKAHGSLMVAQVSHPGRQVFSIIQKDPVSASDVQLVGGVGKAMTFNKPHAASQEEINGFIEGFAHCAEYIEKAGYDGIQLHGAHGYLLAQFLSQTTNKRTDKYGGSLENRARIIVEIAEEIRRRVKPNFIVGIKLNSVEFQEHGFQPEEARELCQILEQNRFDFVELSGGTYEKLAFDTPRESTKQREAFFMDFAEMIVPALQETKAYVTGGFRTVPAMVDALKTVDGVGIGRPLCQEPYLCKEILEGKVNAAIKIKIGENDFALNSVVAGTQIKQIGKDHQPFDASDDNAVESFMKDIQTWKEKQMNDKTGEIYGNADLTSLPVVAYGTTEAV
ncbi:FMN-linked oxidoreductase [Delitschia confertaspora ATCC 74209]|uniref:FMN-linked oxidoreductase n=1 Tax=Delitschia confertaspora ATCC 74209 TaxID=1513339 RepID=A0A9P4MUA5_9PLEO|nr:FMN-linked oxidoreductase [Delitschia confertaspora ATCC 74209]